MPSASRKFWLSYAREQVIPSLFTERIPFKVHYSMNPRECVITVDESFERFLY